MFWMSANIKPKFCVFHHKKIFNRGVGKCIRGAVPTMPPHKTIRKQEIQVGITSYTGNKLVLRPPTHKHNCGLHDVSHQHHPQLRLSARWPVLESVPAFLLLYSRQGNRIWLAPWHVVFRQFLVETRKWVKRRRIMSRSTTSPR